ncbi:serine/threonine-protein kinase [Antarctobacter jejuensis]|uniref:serine/threonine-protein kinase n=1 Tax=Antarctobacter jejuensis TaxID=1439938 RepID=UPI003FD2C68D
MTYQSSIPAAEAPQHFGDALRPGTELCNGQYLIDKYLNSGGFGITYLARDSLGRKVVIKECFPNSICCRAGEAVRLRSESFHVDFGQAVKLFQKEARALAQLQHPNIVGVHQIFEANGTAYMALDFVEGRDLFDLLDQNPDALTPAAIEELAYVLLDALCYVHQNGILHRDISPDNILLDTSGTPVLIDFGAARQSATQASRILSRVHTVKDGYSPQEFYIAGSDQSPASDLYALAATFVHLITGSPPPNSSLRLAAVAEQRPDPYRPLASFCSGYDPRFLAAIDKCLCLFAKDRLPTAEAWLAAISGEPQVPADAGPASIATAPDPVIDLAIAEMVQINNRAIAEEAETTPPAPPPTPQEDHEAAKRAAEREYWAILNEDPADWEQVPAEPTTPQHAHEETDQEPPPRRRFSLSALLPWSARSTRQSIQSNI